MGSIIEYLRPDGRMASGYLAEASGDSAPGVAVIQEWWGLVDQIKGVCERLAQAGYHALAPDLYGGKLVSYHNVGGAAKAMEELDFIDVVDQAARGAVQHLKTFAPAVGLTGFCMGGAITVLGALRIPELDAAVAFYGLPPEEALQMDQLRVPFQAHFAELDDWCTPKAVDAFEQKLKQSPHVCELYRYPGVHHAFMNEQRPDAYDPQAAQQAWQRMLDFFRQQFSV